MGAESSPHHPPHSGRPQLPSADERFRLLVDSIPDYGIVMLDPEGWVTTWNSGAERIKGYASEEVIGRHFSMFYSATDVERGKPALELRAAAETGRFEDEGWRIRKDGSRFWANVVITALRTNGELIAFAKVTRDLTQHRHVEDALRRSEARLSGIIASAMDAIVSVNEEQRIVVFNVAAETMFRCPAHEAIGTRLDRFIPQRFREAHGRHIEAFGRTGVTSRSMWTPGTLVGMRADGEEFPIEATISQMEAGGQRFYTVILRDVTERRRADEALEESNRQLTRMATEAAAANRIKAEFLAMMSHELRTPLNAIVGYAQIVDLGLRGPVTTPQRQDLNRIATSARHLLAVINNILNFARLEAGHLEYRMEDVPLAEAIAEVSTLLEPEMLRKAIVCEARACDPAVAARADPDKLRQILLNLLTNATKFTEPRGRVWVECEAAGNQAVIRVRDTGCGISPEDVERIFEPFVQLERSLTNTVQGTGLGLAISRDLARGMGGNLTVASEAASGSTFTLTLPLAHPRALERGQSKKSSERRRSA